MRIIRSSSGLLSAITQLQQGKNKSLSWVDLQSKWCMRHLGANFYKQFHNKDLMNMFKRLGNQNQQRKFDTLWKILYERTRTHRRETAKKPTASTDNIPKALPE